MAEELQHLIDRIQREAVDTGEKEAARIVSQAREKAAAMIREAEEGAKSHREKAELEARQFTERSFQALEQASRDVLITVGQSVERLLRQIAGVSVEGAMTGEVMQQMLIKLAEGYAAHAGAKLEVILGEADRQKLEQFVFGKLKEKLEGGVHLTADAAMTQGFRVQWNGETAVHDFSQEAIADSLSAFLRPKLAEVVHRVARETAQSPSTSA